MSVDLERAFGKAMLDLYKESKDVGYTAGYFSECSATSAQPKLRGVST